MFNLLKIIRIKQWVKNTFIFFPLIFAQKFFNIPQLVTCLWTFTAFCLLSSSLYILNDLIDEKSDRLHPKKALRPLAKGPYNRSNVILLLFIMLCGGLLLCQKINSLVLLVAVIFILLHLVYNLYTKKVVILDVIFIALGFHLRIWAGSMAVTIEPSVWLQLCVFLLALFLGFTKRRYEIAALKEKASEHRTVLAHYSMYLLDQIIMICSTLTIVFYGLYTISSDIVNRIGHQNMVYSLGFVIYGIFRYLYLVHVRKTGDDPGELLLSDWPLLICVVLWVLFVGALIYMPKFF